MSNIDFKKMKKEFDYEKEKNNFSVEDFLKENEEKLQKIKEWESTQKFVSSFEDYSDGDKNC